MDILNIAPRTAMKVNVGEKAYGHHYSQNYIHSLMIATLKAVLM